MADRILALDPSDHLGFCHGEPDGKPIYGVHVFPSGSSVTAGHMGVLLESFLIDIVKANDIKKVVFEKPIMPRITSFEAMSKMLGKAIVISMASYKLGIKAIPIDMATWRSGFGVPTQAPRSMPNKTSSDKSARRKWVKDQTIARCHMHGYDPKDDNAADAIGIWHHYCIKSTAHIRAPSLFDGLEI